MARKTKNGKRKMVPSAAFARTVRASFDIAQTTDDNRNHWNAADSSSADVEASAEARQTIRNRARYEIGNNSYAKGLVQMLANDTIGTGPRIQIHSDSEELNDQLEAAFNHWVREQKLSLKLRLMRIARCQDGETFVMFGYNPNMVDDVKLSITVIEADRIQSETSFSQNEDEVDGIKFDKYGNPSSYRVLKYHPGDDNPTDEAVYVDAKQMIHSFVMTRPGLHRGVSEISAALPLFAQLRRLNLASLAAAEAAADFAAVLYTDAPADGESDSVEPLDSIPLQKNMMVTMPAGWKLGQMESKHPSANHGEFVKSILTEIARCVCATYGIVSGDYSGYNYASGRLDNQIYQKSIIVDRAQWELDVLDPIFKEWLREWCLANGRTLSDDELKSLRHTWFWDGFLHVDPTKEANADATNLAMNATTLARIYAKQGRDYRNELIQRASEIRLLKELGITQEQALPKNNDNEEEQQ